MKMKNEITITRREFHDTFSKVMTECVSDPLDVLKFAMAGAKAEMRFFGERDEDNSEPEAPFKSGDAVFVTDNEGDGNTFVNRVVTVIKVDDCDMCEVTDGEHEQMIYFKNMRKVETP